MTQQASVVIKELTKRFGAFIAVDALNLEVEKGEIFGFLGPNGAGKSTTIRMLCGLLRPTSGKATVAGFDIARAPEAVRRNIGYMSQKFSLYDDLTVIENLRLFAGLYTVPSAQRNERMQWVLDMATLRGHESALTRNIPGGWKQRLALGCAVLHKPPVLFLDEPTSGVDPVTRARFWDVIQEMADNGVTVFVSTHYMEEAENCNRLALLFRGQMVALGTPMELKQTSLRGELMLVECGSIAQAMNRIKEIPGVLDISVFGDALHVLVEKNHANMHELRSAIESKNISVTTVKPILPSLEDVFVAFTTGKGAENRTVSQ